VQLDDHRPLLLAPGEGETVADHPDRTLRILAELDQVIVSWFRYGPGRDGPEPHVHHLHTDAFYVLDGTLELPLGPELEPVHARPGTLVAAPPNLAHTFRNSSDAHVSFLNIHAPSVLFGDEIRGVTNSGFEQYPVPEDGGRPLSDAILSTPGEGERLEGHSTTIVKVGGERTGGHLAVYETVLPPRAAGPPMHHHRRTAEVFYVLDGVFDFTVGGSSAVAGPNACVYVPPGVTHTFGNDGDTEACCLTVGGPAGVEAFIREAVHADGSTLAELGRRHDTYLA
jgi:mannose-6-phosphate isomerase-like protein (cupin superfamily)